MFQSRLPLLLSCLLLVFPWHLHAEILRLDGEPRGTTGHLERLVDPDGRHDYASAMAASDWEPLPDSLRAGFTRDVVWLRLRVEAGAQAPVDWVLTLNNALLDEVTLYDFETDGPPKVLRSGEAVGRPLWPVGYRTPSFAVTLQPEQPRWLLLQLKSKNAMSVSARLMPFPRFGEWTRLEYLGFGLYFGIYLALIVFHGVFWRMTRAPESGWYLVYVSCCAAIEALSYGLLQQAFGLTVAVSDPILGCLLAASLPIGFIFAQRQLRVLDYAHFRRVLTGLSIVIALLSASAVLAGHYQIGAPLVQIASLLTIPLLVGMALRLLLKGHAPARFFLLVFGIYYVGVGIAFLRNLGMVPATFFTDNAVALGTQLHMLLMSLRIIHYYRELKEERRRARQDYERLLQDHNLELEAQITARTHELRDEIRQRTLLEGELREALQQEQQVREEQRDFVAMVSHEFRTPLAIIATSAQQISRNLAAPPERNRERCQNIRESASRLLSLVDNYLNHDRMAEKTTKLRHVEQDLSQLLALAATDLPGGRVRVDYHTAVRTLSGDTGLLSIALRNLIANADRHAPADSTLVIDVRSDDRQLAIRVINDGPEIPEEQATLLFQKYFRGSQAQQSPGAGLGLYLVRRIAELHGGSVELESRGAQAPICFCLTLPTTASEPRSATG